MPVVQILLMGATFIGLGVLLLRKDNESVELAGAAGAAVYVQYLQCPLEQLRQSFPRGAESLGSDLDRLLQKAQ